MSSLDSMDTNNIDVGNIVLKTQKKLLSAFSNRKMIGPVLDDEGKKLLNSAYYLFKETIGKKDAEKMTSRWIKILMKVIFLVKNDQLDREEISILNDVQSKFNTVVKIILSFWKIEYSFEYSHLQEKLNQIESSLIKIVARHMTDKNKSKLKLIFNQISKEKFLTDIFNCDKSSKLGLAMNQFTEQLESLANQSQF